MAHPDFEASRFRALADLEAKLGIGQNKPVRCRVIFPSDRYALAEMPGGRAPSFYQHRYLRLMVNERDLPEGMSVSDLVKGFEFTAPVVGEDDQRGDRIRISWLDKGPITPMAAPPKGQAPATERTSDKRGTAKPKREKAAPAKPARAAKAEAASPAEWPDEALEKRFNINTEQPALIRVDRALRRLVLGHAFIAGNEETFPVRVGILRKFVPESTPITRWRGTVLKCRVVRGPGDKVRYDGEQGVELVSTPESTEKDDSAPAAQTESNAAEAPEAPSAEEAKTAASSAEATEATPAPPPEAPQAEESAPSASEPSAGAEEAETQPAVSPELPPDAGASDAAE